MLYFYGYRIDRNCAKCPKTTAIVNKIPGMKTAVFSILSPKMHIPNHRGPYKGVLRYHLGLVIPEPANKCRIRVGDLVRHWKPGESMILDDTINHEVWNECDSPRAILFIDFMRELPWPVSWLNGVLFMTMRQSLFIKNVINKLKIQ